MPDLRALIVSYSFPPVGGAGVQRVLKLTKYLGAHGVQPAVLTVSNPSVPVLDPSLERDFPPGLEIVRARTFEPGYAMKKAAWNADAPAAEPTLKKRAVRALSSFAKELLVPDPQVLWQPAAQRALAMRLAERRDDVVFISGPPFSQFLLALLARLRSGVGVVLDYRDEWSTYRTTYEMMGGKLAQRIGDPLEAAILRRAHMITTATDEFRENLLSRFTFLDPARVRAIPNGYDPDDFPPDIRSVQRDASRFVVSYAGTVFKLTSARGLLGAVRRLHQREPALAKRLTLRFMGRIVDTELDAFAGTEALGVERLGYVPHDRVLRELAASDLVLCLLDDVPGAERIYPAKIFELMYLQRPTLTLAPPGALTKLVERHRLGDVVSPRDEAAIADVLAAKLRGSASASALDRDGHESHPRIAEPPQHGGGTSVGIGTGIERYHRAALAGEFAEVLREARRRATERAGRSGRAYHRATAQDH